MVQVLESAEAKFLTSEVELMALANFTLATLFSLHYNIYKDKVKIATSKISYLN